MHTKIVEKHTTLKPEPSNARAMNTAAARGSKRKDEKKQLSN